MDRDVPQLEYAPPPPWYRSARFRRRMLVAFLLGVVLSSWYWGPIACRRARLLYWQHKCLTYTGSPDEVVLERDPGRAAALLSDRPGVYQSDGSAARRANEPAARFCTAPDGLPWPPIFMHERQSRKGVRRLVVWWDTPLHNTTLYSGGGHHVRVGVYPIVPCIGSQHGQVLWARPGKIPHAATRLYCGQPDPDDPSHFSIGFEEADGTRGTIHGWLTDDGNDIKTEVRYP